MFRWLILLLIALTIAMIVCVRILDRNLVKNLAKNRKTVVHLIWNAVFTVVCYTVFLLIPPWYERAAAFASSFYYIATDWLVVHLVLFCVSYTRREYAARLPRRLIGMLAGADSASLLINPFTHHMYRLNLSGPGGWGTSCWEIQMKLPHVAHRVFVYALAAYSLFLLFSRMLQVPDIYKRKYGSILLHTLMVLVINLICLALHTRYDYSVILYASLAMVISYLVMYATPRILLERIVGTVVEDSFIGLFAYDKDGHCVETNQIARELLAVEGDIQAAAEAYLGRWKEEHGDEDSPAEGEEQVLERDGKKLYLYITYQKFLDAKGRLQGSCFRFEDRTQMVEKFQEEQYRASHDLLTGLLNRSAFEQRVRQILSEATEPYCMLSTNIKDFKLINELYGAEVGDRLLIAQAQEIQKVAVEESVSARLYADRFCSLIPRRCFQEDHITEHMAVVVEQGPGKAFRLHYYIGVYDIVDVDEPVWTMYDKASMAIETIRGDYEKFISYYREEVMQHMMEEKEVLGDFDKALAERQFQMYLQPQIDRNGDTVGAEALVRWAHPGKGMVNPALFIPALERAGLIYRLDLYMWENAAERLQEWKRQG